MFEAVLSWNLLWHDCVNCPKRIASKALGWIGSPQHKMPRLAYNTVVVSYQTKNDSFIF